MIAILPERDPGGRPPTARLLGLAVLLLAGTAAAQTPRMLPPQVDAGVFSLPVKLAAEHDKAVAAISLAAEHDKAVAAISGFEPTQPSLPEKPPRPPAEVSAFVDNVNTTDATFEVVMGQGRLLTLREDLAAGPSRARPLIAVGDPSIVDFTPVNTRQIRLIGLRFGTTDLSITTWDNRVYTLEVQVVADLYVLRAQLKAMFPEASLKLAQIRDHVVVEGEARDHQQVAKIVETIKSYLVSLQASELRKISGQSVGGSSRPAQGEGKQPPLVAANGDSGAGGREPVPAPAEAGPDKGTVNIDAQVPEPHLINLIRVPGPQQVMLKVRVAELNRTALREIGADVLGVDPKTGAIVGSQIGGAGISALATLTGQGLTGLATGSNSTNTSVFGIFESGHFEFLLDALRRNAILKVLAEPNLVALNGHAASFLAGGEFPVPVPQTSSGGAAPAVTVQFREFGVRLEFLPFIMDGDLIRLTVDPEVSSIDFTIGTVLVPGGSPVPGLNTRKSHTTVELRQGQTLAIAGLLQLTLNGQTSRIPGLGDLPYIGPFFSNTSNSRVEKELVVLVTPYLVEPMNPCQVPPSPGDEVREPSDLEAYLLGHIEGCDDGAEVRSTTNWEDPLHLKQLLDLENKHVRGPHGFCE
ncbi:MAG TPA: pilus assembly protein N-terminal domain-containing protein [Gemmataceae bacterium]|jgi:pilus assembly protein CpaC|nr:pilus assembly protein N-terminal domain-containing protein [Gemmataceae bacterium]